MAEVVLDNVSRVYAGGVVAVDNLSLTVADREFVVLVGPSGCGKTTTLRMIAGLEEVTSGQVRIGGRVVNDVAPKDRDIAMVFQNYALYPHMNVYKNMAFGLELRYGGGLLRRAWWRLTQPERARRMAAERRRIGERVRQTARGLGIEPLLGRLPAQLSGGERQRVALGRAIVREPAAFLFDEPLSNLDARLRLEMRRELKQLHRRLGATMVYVTHDQVEAMTLGDRIAVLNGGQIQQFGTPREIYEQPRNQFVAGFVGSPPMNFCHGRLSQSEQAGFHQLALVGEGWSLSVPADAAATLAPFVGQEVVLGIRPEDLRVAATDRVGSRSSTSEGELSLAARIVLVELLGDATVLHLDPVHSSAKSEPPINRAASLLAKADGRTAWATGQRVEGVFESARCHWFSARSGENLMARQAKAA